MCRFIEKKVPEKWETAREIGMRKIFKERECGEPGIYGVKELNQLRKA